MSGCGKRDRGHRGWTGGSGRDGSSDRGAFSCRGASERVETSGEGETAGVPLTGAGERSEQEKDWNAQMAAVRIEVEHGFTIVTNLWPFLNADWKMHIYGSPIGRYYRVGVLLANAVNCLHPKGIQHCCCSPCSIYKRLCVHLCNSADLPVRCVVCCNKPGLCE